MVTTEGLAEGRRGTAVSQSRHPCRGRAFPPLGSETSPQIQGRGDEPLFRLKKEEHARRRQAHVMLGTIVVSTTVGTVELTFPGRAQTLRAAPRHPGSRRQDRAGAARFHARLIPLRRSVAAHRGSTGSAVFLFLCSHKKKKTATTTKKAANITLHASRAIYGHVDERARACACVRACVRAGFGSRISIVTFATGKQRRTTAQKQKRSSVNSSC